MGREPELRVLRALRIEGESRGVVLSGGPGVGTTRLALDYLETWRKAGAATCWLASSRASTGLPLGVFAAFLPGSIEVDVPPARQTDLLRRCVAALTEAAGGRPIVLAADNAHLLDDVSATLVHQLVDNAGAFLIATVARGEPLPAPLQALGRDGAIARLDVAELTGEATEQLVVGLLGGPADKALVAELTRLCGGDLRYLYELVRSGLGDGTLALESGVWRQVRPRQPSARLAELVNARLADLVDEERAVLEVVAFGEPLAVSDLAALAPLPVAERLERRGLLTCEPGEPGLLARLRYPVHGLVLRADMPALRRRDIGEALTALLSARPTLRPADVLRVAGWQLAHGGRDGALILRGALIARERGDLALAEAFARACAPGFDAPGFDVELLLAQLALSGGREAEGEASLHRLLARATDDRQRYRVAAAWMDTLAFGKGQVVAAVRIAELAEPSVTDPDLRDRLAARRAVLTSVGRGPSAVAPIASALLDRSADAMVAWASVTAAWGHLGSGRTQEALRTTERGHAAHVRAGRELDFSPSLHLIVRVMALAGAGRLDEAHALADEQYRRGVFEPDLEQQAWFSLALCALAPERGSPRSAVVYGRGSVALFRRLGRPRLAAMARNHLVVALALAGQTREARAVLAEAGPEHPYDTVAGGWLQAQAWTSVAEDDVSSAIALLGRAREMAEATGDLVGELSTVHTLARLGAAAEVLRRAEELASRVDGELAGHRLAHIRALADSDPGALDQVGDAFEHAGAPLLAAEAAAQAATGWERRGNTRRAARAAYRSGALAQRCEEPAVPALRGVRQAWLTPAEREVAIRAASGHSNKFIAEELYISRRTVEKQLEHVYGKLGIADRRELAKVLSS
ncbi:MAG TPA: LuxR C-terminal-related transcriptional regulator [Pseudonocardia sp.]|nr:LuxR C-terminal-related transcriptional regulator [Pseudonocardia sp.]